MALHQLELDAFAQTGEQRRAVSGKAIGALAALMLLVVTAGTATAAPETTTNTVKNLVETFVDVVPSCEGGGPLYKGVRTTIPGKDGKRAGDLLNRDFTAAAPNRTWVMDFTYVRTWAGFAYVAFVVDVFAQKIVAWNCATSKDVELVMTPLRMATWQREREGRPVVPGELIGHADAGSPSTHRFASPSIRTSRGSARRSGPSAMPTTTP